MAAAIDFVHVSIVFSGFLMFVIFLIRKCHKAMINIINKDK